MATTALAHMRQTQKRAYHNAGRKSSGLLGNISAAKLPITITHDQWLGAVGTVSLAWRLTSRYDSPTKIDRTLARVFFGNNPPLAS